MAVIQWFRFAWVLSVKALGSHCSSFLNAPVVTVLLEYLDPKNLNVFAYFCSAEQFFIDNCLMFELLIQCS